MGLLKFWPISGSRGFLTERDGRTEIGQPKTSGVGSAGAYSANDSYEKGALVLDPVTKAPTSALHDVPPEVAQQLQDFQTLDDIKAKDTGDDRGALHQARRFCSEGHTAWDAFLSVASAAVGQVILTYPYQLALMGIIPGIFVGVGVGLLNYYTLWLLIILYMQRKKNMVRDGTWYNSIDSDGYLRRKTVTQYHDVIGFCLGPFLALVAQILTAIFILGVAIQQVVASSSSQYAIDKRFDKRQWSLILGGPILIFGLLPSFRSVRLLNLIALIGTNYSCLYFIIAAAGHGRHSEYITRPPQSLQSFFLGAAVVGSAGHSINMEMMDSMRRSRKFAWAAFAGWVWNIILLQPHSIAIVLAYPNEILKQANVYAILPNNGWKYFSVYIMLIHNIGAFTLHTNPLLYMWEKMIFVHDKIWWIRIPARIPVLAAIWVVSLAIPFYGTINSLFSAISIGMTAFVLPSLAFNWYYRTEEARKDCPIRIPWPLNLWGWKPLFFLNAFLFFFFLGTSTGCGIYYSIKQLINNIHTFHWFAACYQCVSAPKVAASLAPAPAPFSNATAFPPASLAFSPR